MGTDLIVRLPNHLGDACMALPALELLAARGHRLTLAGKAWAADLFAAYPWTVLTLPTDRHRRIALLRDRCPSGAAALLLTNSFGSALDFRLAGLRAAGYATDMRRLLLERAFAKPARWHAQAPMHMVEYYYELACLYLGEHAGAPPRDLSLRLPAEKVERARRLLAEAAIAADYVMLCPVAVGRHRGKVKAWPGFGALCRALLDAGSTVVACPGPGETDAVRAAIPGAVVLPETDVGTFAALLAASRLVVANDSGAAHVAAAVGARLITLFGVTDARRTGPWSNAAIGLGSAEAWPTFDEVAAAVQSELRR
jgi:heptosyltransferase-2